MYTYTFITLYYHPTRHRKKKKHRAQPQGLLVIVLLDSSGFGPVFLLLSRSRLGFSTTNGCPKQATPSEVFGVFGVSYFHLTNIEITTIYKHPSRPKIPKFPWFKILGWNQIWNTSNTSWNMESLKFPYHLSYKLLVQYSIHAIRYRYKQSNFLKNPPIPNEKFAKNILQGMSLASNFDDPSWRLVMLNWDIFGELQAVKSAHPYCWIVEKFLQDGMGRWFRNPAFTTG